MTHDEKKALYAELGEKVGLLIASLGMPETPDLPDKPGYKWKLAYKWGDSGYTYEMVEDPNGQGTATNPISWESGMAVRVNYWYTYEGVVKVCVQSGTPTDFEDAAEEYFVAM